MGSSGKVRILFGDFTRAPEFTPNVPDLRTFEIKDMQESIWELNCQSQTVVLSVKRQKYLASARTARAGLGRRVT